MLCTKSLTTIIIVLLIIIIWFYVSEYDHRRVLCGTWAADATFLKENGYHAIVLKIDDNLSDGFLVISKNVEGSTAPSTIVNNEITINNWSRLHKRSPSFRENVKLSYDDNVSGKSISKKVTLNLSKDRTLKMTLPNDTTVKAILYKATDVNSLSS